MSRDSTCLHVLRIAQTIHATMCSLCRALMVSVLIGTGRGFLRVIIRQPISLLPIGTAYAAATLHGSPGALQA
jgi:hypothetical protein